jgi:hypothetical protein
LPRRSSAKPGARRYSMVSNELPVEMPPQSC